MRHNSCIYKCQQSIAEAIGLFNLVIIFHKPKTAKITSGDIERHESVRLSAARCHSSDHLLSEQPGRRRVTWREFRPRDLVDASVGRQLGSDAQDDRRTGPATARLDDHRSAHGHLLRRGQRRQQGKLQFHHHRQRSGNNKKSTCEQNVKKKIFKPPSSIVCGVCA